MNMNIQDLFVLSTRAKYRFATSVGSVTVEDLWDLPLSSQNKVSLNSVAISLSRKLKEADEENFVSTAKKDVETANKLEIVKHIISVRMAENEQKLAEKQRAEQRELINRLIDQKEMEQLGNKSLEELREMAKSV